MDGTTGGPAGEARVRQRAAAALAGVAALASILVFLWSANGPIVDQHGFRQTQTAISVWWMLHGGPWLDYWTPVLGTGWAVPFEFPLYQWLVALLARATGLALDPAGRLVAYLWLVAGLWPATVLIRSYRLPPVTAPAYAILLLASPVYLFWGRAFLIETQALTLAIAFLALFRWGLVARAPAAVPLASLAGTGAALTKGTTLFPFLLLALAMMAAALRAERGRPRRQLAILAGAAAAALPGPLLFAWWNHRADALKSLNPLGRFYRSDATGLVQWNFGTLHQRLSADFLKLFVRGPVDVAGWLGPVLVAGLAIALWRWRRAEPRAAAIAAMLLVAWALPFAVLTNLHIRHNYYQTANAALLAGAMAVALGAVAGRMRPRAFAVLLVVLLASQASRYLVSFAPSVRFGDTEWQHQLGRAVGRAAPPGSAIVGVGLDWSSVVPYYAERRALLLPENSAPTTHAVLADVPARLGGLPLGAVVVCPSALLADPTVAAALARLERGLVRAPSPSCTIYAAARR